MYLNLLYNGKKYLYETNSKLNIGHLKELSEKILNSDKSAMHIVYNNNKYLFPNDKTFLKDLIPKGQKRTAFSIKVNNKDSTNDEGLTTIDEKNCKTPEHSRSSFDDAIKSNSKKQFYKNFSNLWSSQKKFNNTIIYKYNEFLIEIREFYRRVNEVYEELFNNYSQSNINYNNYLSDKNYNDMNNKLTEISQYELQMIKFIEREKFFYQKLNTLIKKCLVLYNNKVLISNKCLQELYKEMFREDLNFKMDESELNITGMNNKYLSPIDHKTSILNRTNSNKKILFEDSFDKTIKIKQKKIFPLLSNNINDNGMIGNNEIIGSKDRKMIISTELGKDGVKRGKIVLFSEEDKKRSLFGNKKDNNYNTSNSTNRNKNKNENGQPKLEEDQEKDEEEKYNNQKMNLIKNRLISRNKKNKDFFVHFNTKDDKIKNKSVLRQLSSEGSISDKNKMKNIKMTKQKSSIEINNLPMMNLNKKKNNSNKNKNIEEKTINNFINKNNNENKYLSNNTSELNLTKKYKSSRFSKSKINSDDKENAIKKEEKEKEKENKNKEKKEINENKENKEIKEIINNIDNKINNKDNKEIKKNKSNKPNQNEEKKSSEDNKTKNDNENSNSNIKSNISDSSELARKKISDLPLNASSNFISNINISSRNQSNTSIINMKGINNNNKNKVKISENEVNNDNKNENEKRNSKNLNKDNKENKDNNDLNKDKNDKNEKDIHNYNYQDSMKKLMFKNSSSKKINLKEKKKKKKRSDDNTSNGEDEKNDNDVNDDDDEVNKRKNKLKKKYENETIEEKNESDDESKKENNKDPFDDINLLRSLLVDKDNPYKRGGPQTRKNNNNINNENELVKPEPVVNSDEEEEQKKINMLKRKKKQLIKNKYDFLI